MPIKEHKKYSYKLRGLNISHANHVWSTDITYIKIAGGMGKYQDLYDADADAIAMADVLHYNRLTFDEIRKKSTISGIIVRDYD